MGSLIFITVVGAATILLLLLFIGGVALKAFLKKEKEPQQSKRYVPSGPQDLHIRTHGLAVFWFEIGCPKEIGTQVDVKMKSGKTAVYELRNIEPVPNSDWSWYDLEFVRYKLQDATDGPLGDTNK